MTALFVTSMVPDFENDDGPTIANPTLLMTIPGATTSATWSDPWVVCPLHPRVASGSTRPAIISRGRRAKDRVVLGALTVVSLDSTRAECKCDAAEHRPLFGP